VKCLSAGQHVCFAILFYHSFVRNNLFVLTRSGAYDMFTHFYVLTETCLLLSGILSHAPLLLHSYVRCSFDDMYLERL
jgi:hypothetical protein